MEATIRRSVTIFTLTVLLTGCGKSPDPAEPATDSPATQAGTADDTPREPATVEETARLLDLTKVPLLPEHRLVGRRKLGRVNYQAKGEVKTAYEFHRNNLIEQGWKELPDARISVEEAQSKFMREGFLVTLGMSQDKELVGVSLYNLGNVRPATLPVPADVKTEHQGPTQANYVTKGKIADVAEACRKVLMDKGWQPYGSISYDQKVYAGQRMEFKKNAILLHVSVSTYENRPGDTTISYSTGVVSADLPASANANKLTYSDDDKILTFETPDAVATVIGFYRDTLAKQSWKPTKEPEGATEATVYFRNPAGDLITLKVKGSGEATNVRVNHLTAAEIAELDRAIKAKEEREEKERNKPQPPKPTLALPIPENAKAIKRNTATVVTFKLAAGSSKTVVDFYRKHFKAEAGWKEERANLDPMIGSVEFKKDDGKKLAVRYTDVGRGQDCDVSVWSSDDLQLPKEKTKE
jgi:hypothetical protein